MYIKLPQFKTSPIAKKLDLLAIGLVGFAALCEPLKLPDALAGFASLYLAIRYVYPFFKH